MGRKPKEPKDKLDRIIEMLDLIIIKKEIDMSAELDRLTASITALNTKVDALIAGQPNDGPALTALADSVDAEAAKVDAALPKP